MSKLVTTFRSFFTAEEIPRWFGLSIILIYLAGLGAVARLGIVETRTRAMQELRSQAQYAVLLLGAKVAEVMEHDRSGPDLHETDRASEPSAPSSQPRKLQRILREFGQAYTSLGTRVLDGHGRVMASTDAGEIGLQRHSVSPKSIAPGGIHAAMMRDDNGDAWQHVVTTAVSLSRNPAENSRSTVEPSTAGSVVPGIAGTLPPPMEPVTPGADEAARPPAAAAPYFIIIEARFPATLPALSGFTDSATILTFVLVSCGILFVLFRWARHQLRGASRIAQRLMDGADPLGHDIMALRIQDEHDASVQSWNRLIEFIAQLKHEVQRFESDREICTVLARSTDSGLGDALNVLPDGMAYMTPDGTFRYVNATFSYLLGRTPDELVEAGLAEAQAENVGARILEVLRSVWNRDVGFMACSELIELPETDSAYRAWVIPLERDGHEGEALALVRDVSQQVRSDRAREEFVAQVTHELRTPLTNIRAYTETLSSGMFDDPSVITECYNVITKETRRLSRLIEDMLNVSQMEIGGIELIVDTVDLRTLLTDAVRDVRGLADEKNIDLQLALPAKMEPVRGDRDKLNVVVNNLLGNAIKYTPSNGGVIVSCQYKPDAVILNVKDNGIGIAPKDQARVFEKFQRGTDPEVKAQTGTGIGLYTAREIIRRHGGDIQVISAKGQGTTMMVKLPHQESRAGALSMHGREG